MARSARRRSLETANTSAVSSALLVFALSRDLPRPAEGRPSRTRRGAASVHLRCLRCFVFKIRFRRRTLSNSVDPLAVENGREPVTETSLRIVIVDDEALARAVVREYAAGDPEIEIVADCANGFEAVKAVAELTPDLVLLDVQMPKLDGFEVLELLGRDQPVIFITAYDQYALRAFEVHAVDYLLKPFSAERFQEAIARARERLRAKAATPVDEIVRDAKPRT